MSNIKYGLISQTDARTLEKTIDLIVDEFKDDLIKVTEIGLYNCETSLAIAHYIDVEKNRVFYYTGIDNEKDKPIEPPMWIRYIKGNSNEVYNQLQNNSQHLIFIDGCHCFAHVISDFYCYADKVKVGGYMAFHDTGKHIKPFKDFQHGDKDNPDAYISVRKALYKIGLIGYAINMEEIISSGLSVEDTIKLLNNTGAIPAHSQTLNGKLRKEWQLIFDEADETDLAGGICVFKKLY